MRERMTAVALENGLTGGVQEDSVELMLHALEVMNARWRWLLLMKNICHQPMANDFF